MEFNSKIATTKEQSERLLALGLKPETADCYLLQINDGDWENYETQAFASFMDREKMLTMGSIFPAWSLSRLLELLPVEVPDPKPGFEPHHPELIINPFGYIVSIRRATADCLIGTHIEGSPIECCVSMIGWLIKNKHFNKEYLK